MIRVALICHVNQDAEELRLKLRGQHLAYLGKHRESILIGGPTVKEGRPERMLLLMQFPDLGAAEAFIAAEPYNAHGVFASVELRVWNQVLPELTSGEFDRALALELAKGE